MTGPGSQARPIEVMDQCSARRLANHARGETTGLLRLRAPCTTDLLKDFSDFLEDFIDFLRDSTDFLKDFIFSWRISHNSSRIS